MDALILQAKGNKKQARRLSNKGLAALERARLEIACLDDGTGGSGGTGR